MGQSLRGDTIFTTQGDANNAADDLAGLAGAGQGKLWYSVPYLGHVNDVLTGSQRQLATYGVAGLLALYAAYMFIRPRRDRRKRASTVNGGGGVMKSLWRCLTCMTLLLLGCASAQAADEIGLSRDGVTWASELARRAVRRRIQVGPG